jgi:AraC-like DNA-binding protein
MEYREYPPCEALRPFIQCYWTLRGHSREPQPHLVFPDGHMEIIFHLAEPFALSGEDGVMRRQCETLVAGQIWTPVVLQQARSADVLAVRFHAGGAANFTRFPQNEVAGMIANLEDFWGRKARQVRDALGETDSPALRVRLLEKFLLGMKPGEPVALGALSPRQYRRRFEETVGLPPKLYQRIRRFQAALAVLGRRPVAEVALECGYYDQAHLIRDFKQFAGLTPTAWLRGRENVLFFQDPMELETLS